jgi:hypothetical protein
MAQESGYTCPCGVLLVWKGPAEAGAYHNGTRPYTRHAACPTCETRYVVRLWECTFRPRGILSERWFALAADGTETPSAVVKAPPARKERAAAR